MACVEPGTEMVDSEPGIRKFEVDLGLDVRKIKMLFTSSIIALCLWLWL
jgi:hypothetical protein